MERYFTTPWYSPLRINFDSCKSIARKCIRTHEVMEQKKRESLAVSANYISADHIPPTPSSPGKTPNPNPDGNCPVIPTKNLNGDAVDPRLKKVPSKPAFHLAKNNIAPPKQEGNCAPPKQNNIAIRPLGPLARTGRNKGKAVDTPVTPTFFREAAPQQHVFFQTQVLSPPPFVRETAPSPNPFFFKPEIDTDIIMSNNDPYAPVQPQAQPPSQINFEAMLQDNPE